MNDARQCPQIVTLTIQRLRALADEVRVRILLRLRKGEANVTTLVEHLGVAQTSVSKHLSVLRQAGIVNLRREGTQSFYSIRDESVFQVLQLSLDGVKRHQEALTSAIQGDVTFDI